MDRFFWVALTIVLVWLLLTPGPRANWEGGLVAVEPLQHAEALPPAWSSGRMTIVPKAKYEINAVILSKHHYWAGFREDRLAPYDLALGWGPMSDAAVINALEISQSSRWYQYSWNGDPPLDPGEIIRHSSNHHIIAADRNVLRQVRSLRRFDRVLLKGYLVDVASPDGWRWSSSLTREDSGGGSCELFWVDIVERIRVP